MNADECGDFVFTDLDGDTCLVICCLPPSHDGMHWDQVEGWEW